MSNDFPLFISPQPVIVTAARVDKAGGECDSDSGVSNEQQEERRTLGGGPSEAMPSMTAAVQNTQAERWLG